MSALKLSGDRWPTLASPDGADGTLAIEAGILRATPPQGRGAYPTIAPGRNVRIFYGDEPCTKPTVILHPERVRLEVIDEPPQLQLQVHVSGDGLTATVRLERRPGARYAIPDHPPARHLVVQAQPVEILPAPPLSVEALRQALAAASVTYGIDEQALHELVSAAGADDRPVHREAVVAHGDPPVPPRDAAVLLAEGVEDGSLVEAGQLLATKRPAEAGRPGRSVRGTPIAPPEPRDVALRALRAAQLSPDGLLVTALRAGRVRVRGSTLEVHPVHRIVGDYGGAGAVLRFSGDVVVFGQIRAGAHILAGGRVEASGGAEGARIEAGTGIALGGAAFRSTLIAGPEAAADTARLAALLARLESELVRLRELIRVAADRTGRSTRELAPWVVERRGAPVREALRELQAVGHEDPAVRELSVWLGSRLMGLGAASIDEPALDGLIARVRETRDALPDEETGDASVRVGYVHNSEVKAAGRIQLTGRGSYQSRLWAGRGLEARVGRLIGGEVVAAGGDVVAQTIGGPTALTRVSVGPDGRICATSILPDVILQFGGKRLKVTRPHRMVCFQLHHGQIRAVAWRG